VSLSLRREPHSGRSNTTSAARAHQVAAADSQNSELAQPSGPASRITG